MKETDTLVTLFTAAMLAFLRLADTIVAVQQGVPVESLRPRRLLDLDEEARHYVEQILAARRTGS